MEHTALKLKPSIVNALTPMLLRNLVYSALFFGVLFGITYLFKWAGTPIISMGLSLALFITLTLVFAAVPLVYELFMLANTTYFFYESHVVREFKFVIIRRMSVVYNQITSVNVKISLWDRMCNAGDIILHTSEDEAPDLKLEFISNPESIEKKIHELTLGPKKE